MSVPELRGCWAEDFAKSQIYFHKLYFRHASTQKHIGATVMAHITRITKTIDLEPENIIDYNRVYVFTPATTLHTSRCTQNASWLSHSFYKTSS